VPVPVGMPRLVAVVITAAVAAVPAGRGRVVNDNFNDISGGHKSSLNSKG
jgi:hypothetical protein